MRSRCTDRSSSHNLSARLLSIVLFTSDIANKVGFCAIMSTSRKGQCFAEKKLEVS